MNLLFSDMHCLHRGKEVIKNMKIIDAALESKRRKMIVL
jgi:hypothetical protein